MCLIVETQKEIVIPRKVMDDMYERNDDGYGFMYIRNGHTIGEKFQGKSNEELYEKYLELKEFSPYIHLRMKTHGDINTEQSHPFYCGHGIWMMHNGVLNDTQGEDKTKSDTWYFANEYLKPVFDHSKNATELLMDKAFQGFINKFIGHGNRVVFIAPGMSGLRFNSSSWHTITNDETKCVGMIVSNTYAWSMHTKSKPPSHSVSRVHYSNGNYYGSYLDKDFDDHWTKNRSKIIVPPGMSKSESKPNDPPGSFRDSNGILWVYTGRGWMVADKFYELYPEKKGTAKIYEGQEATLSHPTLLIGQSDSVKTNEKGFKKSGIERAKEKLNVYLTSEQEPQVLKQPSSIDDSEEDAYAMDAYVDWLYGQWKMKSYEDIIESVLDEPEEAADLIASLLGTKIILEKEPNGNV